MFCPKCGKEIPNQVAFCPKCGAPVHASGGRPQPSPPPPPPQPAAPGKPSGAPGAATPTQKKAGKMLLLTLLLNLILAGMWMSNTFVATKLDDSSLRPMGLVKNYFQVAHGLWANGYIVTWVFALFAPVISGGFLGRHILKKDGMVPIPVLSWLYWIWTAGFHTLAFFIWKAIARADPEPYKFAFSGLGWLYNLLCVVLAVVLVYLTVLHYKTSKEPKA